MTETKTCNCWHETDDRLRKDGYKLADSCAMFDRSFRVQFGLPLQRTDGQKLKRDDPRMITTSHCPFCGVALTLERARAKASRENGKLGGRPRKPKRVAAMPNAEFRNAASGAQQQPKRKKNK